MIFINTRLAHISCRSFPSTTQRGIWKGILWTTLMEPNCLDIARTCSKIWQGQTYHSVRANVLCRTALEGISCTRLASLQKRLYTCTKVQPTVQGPPPIDLVRPTPSRSAKGVVELSTSRSDLGDLASLSSRNCILLPSFSSSSLSIVS
jgi:hypothetical protein